MEVQRPRDTRKYQQERDSQVPRQKKEETFLCTLKMFQKKMLVLTLALPRLVQAKAKTHDDEDYFELSLDEEGEFHLLLLFS